MTVLGLNQDEWNTVAAIATAFGAMATFAAVFVALWLARTPMKPRLVGRLDLQTGPEEIDFYGNETPYKIPPPDWIENRDVMKSFSCTIRNLSDNPAQVAVFYYAERLFGKKKPLQYILSDEGRIGPQGDPQQFSMPNMKMDASTIWRVWIYDTMNRRWRLDISQVKRIQKELKQWKHSKKQH